MRVLQYVLLPLLVLGSGSVLTQDVRAQKPPAQEPRANPVSRPAPPLIVSRVDVMFHTNDDDKDADTKLVTDFMCQDSVFASSSLGWADAGGEITNSAAFPLAFLGGRRTDAFSDNQDTRWMSVKVTNVAGKNGIHNCTTKVRIDPVGHDTWRFNYWVRLYYSDGTHDEYHFDGHALSEKVRENTFPLR